MQRGMSVVEVPENREKRLRIRKFLVCIRIACAFTDLDFRVSFFEIIIKKGNMAHNSKTVGQDARFQRITEMTVDILQLYSGIFCGTVREQSVDCPVWIGSRIEFNQAFCLSKFR